MQNKYERILLFTWVYKILYINYVELLEILNLALKNSTYEEVNGGSTCSNFSVC